MSIAKKGAFRLASVRRGFFAFSDLFYPAVSFFCPQQVYRYAFFGSLNMLFDFLLFILFYYVVFAHMATNGLIPFYLFPITLHSFCLMLATPITVGSGFLLMRFIVFDHSRKASLKKQLIRYIISALTSLLLNFIFLKIFIEQVSLKASVAKILTTIVVVIYSFFFQTFITFRKKKVTPS